MKAAARRALPGRLAAPGSLPVPWLDGAPVECTLARVHLLGSGGSGGSGGALGDGAYATGVRESVFRELLERAARHRGYSARQRTVREYHAHDVVHEQRIPGADPEEADSSRPPHRGDLARTARMRLLETHELRGGPLLACLYAREPLANTHFPCSAELLHEARTARRLELRVHQRARLIFEVHRSSARDAPELVRRVYVDVDLRRPVEPRELTDLRRTVENTIQVVLLGAAPLRRRGPPPRLE